MTNTPYLPQYTLNQLADRVALQLDYIKQLFKADSVWNGIFELCQTIEEEPRNVNTVILESKKDNVNVLPSKSVKRYQIKLTRIYIILYYRHKEDELFKALVFPELQKNMGIYKENKILIEKIHKVIDDIIKQDELVESAKKTKEIKPMFKFKGHTGPERDKLFDEYTDESLFYNIHGYIEVLDKRYGTHLDSPTIWYNAKQVVRGLQRVKRPELFIRRVAVDLVNGQLYDGYDGAQIILLCVYAMVRSKDNPHFKNFIQKMEGMSLENSDMHIIRNHISDLKEIIDTKDLYDDYNYFADYSKTETYTRAELEKLRNQINKQHKDIEEELKNRIKEKETELSNLQSKFKNYKNNNKENIDEIANLQEIIDDYEKKDKGISAHKAALLLTTIYHHIGGLPQKGRQSLKFILSQLTGYTEATCERALTSKFQRKDADSLAEVFIGTSPKLARLIKELPETLDEINKKRLAELGANKNVKKQ